MITGTVGLRGEVPLTPTYELFEQLGTKALSNMIDRSDKDVVALVREEYVVRLKSDPPHARHKRVTASSNVRKITDQFERFRQA
jgi:hypothetical protein